jgi:alanyl-tRNA synthetase
MAATEKLYHHDSLLSSFDAVVVAHGRFGDAASLVLDRTAFYPESGGQMGDRGVLGDLAVRDVQIDDDGVIHHLVDGPLAAPGAAVRGEVDRARRRVHMALHTGQHMLSRALVDEASAETVSSRLGESVCTIDVDLEKLDERAVARAEALVNAVVDDDAPVRAFFPDAAELASLPLRRQPKVSRDIRVVAIGDFDVSPCGGTHCLRTAQVGLLRVTGLERYKGKMRVSFAAGRRARDELAAQAQVIVSLGRELTCGPAEVPTALAKLKRELQETREKLGQARARVMEALAEELLAGGGPVVAALVEDADAEALRLLAKRLTRKPGVVALLAGASGDGIAVLAARAAAASFDCGAFVKRVAAAHGGRGGGRPESAEGRLPAGAVDAAAWAALAAGALSPA